MKKVLITGSSGLIGSEAVSFFLKKNFIVYGIDNDLRSKLFGKKYSTKKFVKVQKKNKHFKFFSINLVNYKTVETLFKKIKFDLIIHTAGQPSHDWSAKDPVFDFKINALSTVNLLQLTKLYCPKSVFIFTSTNKVYGELPKKILNLREKKTRYEAYNKSNKRLLVDEKFPLDDTIHSPFGVSKTSADLMVQEFGKYFNLKSATFRCGCITGPNHQGAELHGFLSYLVNCVVKNKQYKIYGFKGKQVRDNIHSFDLVNMFWEFYKAPGYGEIYNAGGGIENSISIIEAISLIKKITKKKYNNFKIIQKPRVGDHIWYISDLKKFKKQYKKWRITKNLKTIIKEISLTIKK
jgi:CDP-paratose 2-epimerase